MIRDIVYNPEEPLSTVCPYGIFQIFAHVCNNVGKWEGNVANHIYNEHIKMRLWNPKILFDNWYVDNVLVAKRLRCLPLGTIQFCNISHTYTIGNMVVVDKLNDKNDFKYDSFIRCIRTLNEVADKYANTTIISLVDLEKEYGVDERFLIKEIEKNISKKNEFCLLRNSVEKSLISRLISKVC